MKKCLNMKHSVIGSDSDWLREVLLVGGKCICTKARKQKRKRERERERERERAREIEREREGGRGEHCCTYSRMPAEATGGTVSSLVFSGQDSLKCQVVRFTLSQLGQARRGLAE